MKIRTNSDVYGLPCYYFAGKIWEFVAVGITTSWPEFVGGCLLSLLVVVARRKREVKEEKRRRRGGKGRGKGRGRVKGGWRWRGESSKGLRCLTPVAAGCVQLLLLRHRCWAEQSSLPLSRPSTSMKSRAAVREEREGRREEEGCWEEKEREHWEERGLRLGGEREERGLRLPSFSFLKISSPPPLFDLVNKLNKTLNGLQ
uniref:Uncharacterized protein n=1 Tax=Solanum lycopersicum TaxID=4081 RepID=K4BZK9_SOLLC